MRVCIAAGGTGGHLLPGLAAAQVLRSRGHAVHFIVKQDASSQARLAREGFSSSAFDFSGFPRRLSWRLIGYPIEGAAAFWAARRVLRRQKPDVVLGMGGYLSVPVGVAAALQRVPLVLHEQNAHPGLANRVLSRWAEAVAMTFETIPGLAGRRLVTTGLPLRPDLVPRNPEDSRRALGLDPTDTTLLIFGGSQGAHGLNVLVTAALPSLGRPGERWQFIHLTGPRDEATLRAAYAQDGRRHFVQPYWPDMATVYSAADHVVCRSGANTVMELRRMGKSALLVPFPFATDDHQTANARFLERAGAARVVSERDLTPEGFAALVNGFGAVEGVRRRTAERLVGLPEDVDRAAERLADLVASVARG